MIVASPENRPEQGQLVSARQQQYVVTEMAKSTLPLFPLGGNIVPVENHP
jgi:hypothetical protein